MTITTTLESEARAELEELTRANLAQSARYPGDKPDRQPVHTVYGGAQLFQADTTVRLGELALASLARYAPDALELARALRLPGDEERRKFGGQLAKWYAEDPAALRKRSRDGWLSFAVYERVTAKLHREPVEDYRIDFEDGFGVRPDPEEDAEAERCAKEVARGMRDKTLPPFIGIRIKTLNEELKVRAVRTLDIFVSTLVREAGTLPNGFVVTLPKITVPEQPRTLVRLFEKLEKRLGLAPGALKMEMMIELTQSIVAPDGSTNLPRLLAACEGRCVGAHFGTYDYTASCNITATWQTMDHPACQFALHMMKNAFATTGIFLSDGATNIMPVGPSKAPAGEKLSEELEAHNASVVRHAWRTMFDHVQGSLRNGFYQGWDLHPAQLPIRYAACYAFFLEGFDAAAERLHNFIAKAAQATLVGDVFDDAATGQGLLNYFLRGLSSGAVSVEELKATGLTAEEVRTRSFVRILAGRTKR